MENYVIMQSLKLHTGRRSSYRRLVNFPRMQREPTDHTMPLSIRWMQYTVFQKNRNPFNIIKASLTKSYSLNLRSYSVVNLKIMMLNIIQTLALKNRSIRAYIIL